jgi:hypothetical protein
MQSLPEDLPPPYGSDWALAQRAPIKKPAPERGFFIDHRSSGPLPYSADSALLKVLLGRIAALALATSGR